MASKSDTPYMRSITVTNAAATSLQARLVAADSTYTNKRCQYLKIQLDSLAGADNLYIGNSNVASNMCGVHLNASQASQDWGGDSNLIDLTAIYLLSDNAGGSQVNVTVITR